MLLTAPVNDSFKFLCLSDLHWKLRGVIAVSKNSQLKWPMGHNSFITLRYFYKRFSLHAFIDTLSSNFLEFSAW